ncbi:MAG: DUF2283 domain-containing protein [Nanoarchaeota archaeon]
MKIRYDSDADAMYIKIRDDKVDHTREVEEDGDVIIDYNKAGQAIGVEILFVKEKNPDLLKQFQIENLVSA